MVVTRAAEQAGSLVAGLLACGADVLELPLISIVLPRDGAALQVALAGLRPGDWLAVTSANGVAAVVALEDPGIAPGVRVAAVGPATADALRSSGIEPSLVAKPSTAEGLADALGPADSERPGRIVLAQGERARPVLAERLAAVGWVVTPVIAYRTIAAPLVPAQLDRAASADAITFTSGSTVEAYLAAAGAERVPPAVICIGPVTADIARGHGLPVTAVADPHTAEGLVAAVIRALAPADRR